MNSAIALALAAYMLMSAIAFTAYRLDKSRAIHGRRRISEATLHTIELLGGWPGAWAAQRVLRHKTAKTSYLVVFWGIGALHALGWVWWFARPI